MRISSRLKHQTIWTSTHINTAARSQKDVGKQLRQLREVSEARTVRRACGSTRTAACPSPKSRTSFPCVEFREQRQTTEDKSARKHEQYKIEFIDETSRFNLVLLLFFHDSPAHHVHITLLSSFRYPYRSQTRRTKRDMILWIFSFLTTLSTFFIRGMHKESARKNNSNGPLT